MPYTQLQSLSAEEFKRLCGVSHPTFGDMVEVLRPQLERQRKRVCNTTNICTVLLLQTVIS